MTKQTLHTLVGAVVVSLGALAIILSQTGGRTAATDGYALSGRFGATDGVAIGTKVLLTGIPVGEITQQYYDRDGEQAVLVFTIRSDVQLPLDSVAMIVSDGLLGNKYIKIQAGGEEEMMRAGEEFEYVQDSISFEEILEKVILNAEHNRSKSKETEPDKRSPNEAFLDLGIDGMGRLRPPAGSAEAPSRS